MHLYFCKSLHFKNLLSEIQEERDFVSEKSKKLADTMQTYVCFCHKL